MALLLHYYFVTVVILNTTEKKYMSPKLITRTQTGVRIETSLLKVLKGLAEYTNLSFGDLLEGIVLHSFEGKAPFSKETRSVISQLKTVYGCELTAVDSHKLKEDKS
jgi:hypothetical protein